MSGGTLIYTPGLSVIIESHREGLIDVSDDVSAGSLSLRENADHTVQLMLENPRGKYDGAFAPNDRIAIQLKRFRWMQVFVGYLDDVPYFSAYPRPISLQATCTRKILKNWPWDRGSQKAFDLIHRDRDRSASDGGMAEVVTNILSEVVRWPKERIHIGRVPTEWQDRFKDIYEAVVGEVEGSRSILGTNPILSGTPGGGGGSVPGTNMSNDQLEALTVSEAEIDVVLATIREVESGNDYHVQNRWASASGAYQVVDRTWRAYPESAGYARAYLAPVAVQDAWARARVLGVIQKYGNKLLNIPRWWYVPASLDNPTRWLDRPAGELGAGNTLTVRQYSYKWGNVYGGKYQQMRGSTAPSRLGGGSIPGIGQVPGIEYPIPAGINRLKHSEVGWGGYRNGFIPTSALGYSEYAGQGHPIAVEAWTKLAKAAEADGINVRGYMYRSYQGQQELSTGAGVKVAGTSNHGWGLAVDVTRLSQMSRSAAFASPEYAWLKANAYKYGFGHPDWAQQGGSKPEAWHWEFFAIYNMLGATGTPGVNPFDESVMGQDIRAQMYSAIEDWMGGSLSDERDTLSDLLFGYRALMNDEPILQTIDPLIRTAGRNYCMAPNGDFIAWFPDYWGEFGIAGALELKPIEMQDFTARWNDAPMITHQYVEGAFNPQPYGPLPGGVKSRLHAQTTQGMATVSMPGLLEKIINAPQGDMRWINSPEALLKRFGARVSRVSEPTIFGPHQEFWFAVQKFMRAWAMQFPARVPMTFMPELFPGMLLKIPDFGVQFYVSEVTHSWDLSGNSGFTTTASVMAPSAMDGSGFYMLPRGGHVFNRPSGGAGSNRPV